MKKTLKKAIITILSVLICLVLAAGGVLLYLMVPTVTVDFSSQSELTGRASGFLYGFAEEDIPSSNEGGTWPELRGYLIGKVLWNADITLEEYNRHMDEFLAAYYGEGWQGVRKYIDKTEEREFLFASAHAGDVELVDVKLLQLFR